MTEEEPLEVLIVSYSDYGGGAHRAISRIHEALVRCGPLVGIRSTLRVIKTEGELPDVISGYPKVGPVAHLRRFSRLFLRKLSKFIIRTTGDRAVYSRANIRTGLGKEIERSNADIVLINWIGDYTVSLEELLEARKPIVIRLADHWFLLGDAHFPPPCIEEDNSRKLPGRTGDNLPRKWNTSLRPAHKRLLDQCVVGTVSPSRAIQSLARQNPHLGQKLNDVIPNPIDCDFWSPIPMESARRFHDIPPNSFSIVFGAVDGFNDPRKGGAAFLKAMQLLMEAHKLHSPPIRVDSFGGRAKGPDERIPWLHHHGPLNDDELRNLYSAGDVFVSTSLFETFGNTVLESMACGTPVIAFDIPAYQDLIEHEKTGLFAANADPQDLARQLSRALSEREWLHNAGESAREVARSNFGALKIATMYSQLLRQASTEAIANFD